MNADYSLRRFTALAARWTCERKGVIVTTTLPFGQWTKVLGSERLTGVVLDRLTHRCQIMEARGESYRLKDTRRQGQDDVVAVEKAEPSPPTRRNRRGDPVPLRQG